MLSNASGGRGAALHLSAGRIQAGSRRLASRKRRFLLQSLRGVAAIQRSSLCIHPWVPARSCGSRVGTSTMGWAGDAGCTPRPPIRPRPASERRVVTVIFLGLLLDLLAFTLLLPLLPGLLESHGRQQDPLYGSWQRGVDWFATAIGMPAEKRYNSVLFGGLIGSAFSFLQFFSAPLTGAASDCLGRRPMMLLSLTGLAVSYAVWAASRSFTAFLASRVIGGISKGNVSLSTAIVADLGSPPTRSQGMSSESPSPWPLLWAPCLEHSCLWKWFPGSAYSLRSPTYCSSSSSCQRHCPRRSGLPLSPWASMLLPTCSAPWPCCVLQLLPTVRIHLLKADSEAYADWVSFTSSTSSCSQAWSTHSASLHTSASSSAGHLCPTNQPWQGSCSCEAGIVAAGTSLSLHWLGALTAHVGLGAAALLLRGCCCGTWSVHHGLQLWFSRAKRHDHGHTAEPRRPR
ncbi:major facilitator superfamily domain-containing protein 10 isoform X3 [Onychomys torridus]|uniref:major facilitator superfamily domain-containing protein 10 isoform X3 n=1 Tax=Onychomys torridus TaxID=38674 RepID=UPI00167F3C0C|nr:major facilitator superfamily domain-containing protein 10 isoform X3 [Onychomys torridus]